MESACEDDGNDKVKSIAIHIDRPPLIVAMSSINNFAPNPLPSCSVNGRLIEELTFGIVVPEWTLLRALHRRRRLESWKNGREPTVLAGANRPLRVIGRWYHDVTALTLSSTCLDSLN